MIKQKWHELSGNQDNFTTECEDCNYYYDANEVPATYLQPRECDDCPRCQRKEHLKWLITRKLRKPTPLESMIAKFEDTAKQINLIMER